MTKTQFKQSLNAELRSNDLGEHHIKKVDDVGVNTVLVFDVQQQPLNMKLLKWLNNRFQNGISVTDTDHSLVFINTPLEGKKEIS